MNKLLHYWRYYSFGKDQYYECMGKIFVNNLSSLRQANAMAAVFIGVYSLFPILYERNFINAVFCLGAALIALLLSLYSNYKLQTTIVNNRFIYIYTVLFYANVIAFGIYLGIWSTPDKLATIFLCLLICALLMFINPPLFNLILTLCGMAVFIVLTVLFKIPENALYDIIGAIVAGVFSLYFTWQISKLRMGMEIYTYILEDERNKYFSQSTIDELTKLNNRRDFMHTFQRYLSKNRTSDDYLCIAISDIDFFKNYNDHYGHPMGDSCLRSIGMIFNELKENLGVYTARVGGEEFAMLWFEKDASHVDNVVSAVNKLVTDLKIPHEKSLISEYITISMGIYVERLGEHTNIDTLYDFADKALYAAKGSGRNCTVVTGCDIKEYRIPPAS